VHCDVLLKSFPELLLDPGTAGFEELGFVLWALSNSYLSFRLRILRSTLFNVSVNFSLMLFLDAVGGYSSDS